MEDAEQNPGAFSPRDQNSVIPLGWKPTAAKPVPVVRCIVIKKSGERCGRWSLRGHTKCRTHLKGALNFPNVREHIDAVVEAARMRIVDSSDEAIDTLHTLMEPGTADAVRLKAATEILDRAGIRGGFELDIEVKDTTNPTEVLQDRLNKLRQRREADMLSRGENTDVITGTVISESDEQMLAGQETLF